MMEFLVEVGNNDHGFYGILINVTGHSGHGHTPEISTRGQQPLPIDDDVLVKEVRIQKERYHASHEIKTLKDHDVKRGSTGSMNIKGVYLHILADLLASIIVIISALIIWLTNWPFRNYVDPTLSIIVVILILYSIWPLLKDSSLIMLQNVPAQVKMTALEKKLIREVEEVISIHEFHVWQLTEDRIIATAHIVCRNLNEYINVAAKVKEFFHNEGIHSTTIQPEFVEEKIEECAIECPSVCAEQKCCVTYDDPIEEELPKELTANK